MMYELLFKKKNKNEIIKSEIFNILDDFERYSKTAFIDNNIDLVLVHTTRDEDIIEYELEVINNKIIL